MNAKRSPWLSSQLAERGDTGSYFVHRGAHRGVQTLAGFGEMHASRGALYKRNAYPFFETSEGLTHRGVTHAKSFARCAKPFRLRNSDESRESIELVGHWKEF
jgi:hypothetical protein